MNSLLQQLYHVQGFSLQLLGLVPDRRAGGDESNHPLQEEDEVLLQLQVHTAVVAKLLRTPRRHEDIMFSAG